MAEQTAHEYTLPIVSNMAGKGVVTSTDVDYDPNNLDTSNLKEKSVGAALKQAEDDISNIKTALENTSTLKSVTYSELVSLRDENNLIPGSKYRITDYATTTTQVNTRSALWNFDVIVEATSENTLSEDAKVIKCFNATSSYFDNNDLNAWEIKYCLHNDTSRFAWADAENGKGVIYYMKDEYGNECPYDFKNIQFNISSYQYHPDYEYAYTFTDYDGNDLSLSANTRNNIIKKMTTSGSGLQSLNATVFVCSAIHNNSFEENSSNNLFWVSSYYYNNIGRAFQNNLIAAPTDSDRAPIHNNTIGSLFKSNKIASVFNRNNIGNTISKCNFNSSFEFNRMGDNCDNLNFDYPVNHCKFGSYMKYCVFHSPSQYPPIVNEMKWCTFEGGIDGMQYLSCCQNVTFQQGLHPEASNFEPSNIVLEDGRKFNEALIQAHTDHLYVYRVGDKFGIKKMSSPYIDLGSFDSEADGCSKAASPEIVGNPNINNITFSVNGTDNKVVTIEQYSDGYAGAGQYWVTQYLNSNGKKYSRKILYYITDGVVGITNVQSWVKIIDTDVVVDGPNSRASSRLYSNGEQVVVKSDLDSYAEISSVLNSTLPQQPNDNAVLYGYIGTLKNIGLSSENDIEIKSIKFQIRNNREPQTHPEVYIRLLKKTDRDWAIIAQSNTSKTMGAAGTYMTFDDLYNVSGEKLRNTDIIAITFVQHKDDDRLACTQVEVRTIPVSGGISNGLSYNTTSGVSYSPAFELGYIELQNVNVSAENISFDNSKIQINSSTVQNAITELRGYVGDNSQNIQKITYQELLDLKIKDSLIPGKKYRIVDYDTTVDPGHSSTITIVQNEYKGDTESNRFDVIVEAINSHDLSENAQVSHCHTSLYNDTNSAIYGVIDHVNRSVWNSSSWITNENDVVRRVPDVLKNKYKGQSIRVGILTRTIDPNTNFRIQAKPHVETQSHDKILHIIGMDFVDQTSGEIYSADYGEIEVFSDTPVTFAHLLQPNITQTTTVVYRIFVLDDPEIEETAGDAQISLETYVPYFRYNELYSWKIKYCLHNDTSRFAWADAENGKGVIYYMKDENGNEAPYDFKNILFNGYYTFHSDSLDEDMSLYGNMCSNNSIKELIDENGVMQLPGNVLISVNDNDVFRDNIFNSGVRNCMLVTATSSLVKFNIVNYEFINGVADKTYIVNSALNSSAPYWDKKYISTMSGDTPGSAARYGVTSLLSSLVSINSSLNNKQATLKSGINIKTINGESLLGAGDISWLSKNIIVNSNFDKGSNIEDNTPWSYKPEGTGGSICSIVNNSSLTGKENINAIEFKGSTISQNVKVKPGKTYTLSFGYVVGDHNNGYFDYGHKLDNMVTITSSTNMTGNSSGYELNATSFAYLKATVVIKVNESDSEFIELPISFTNTSGSSALVVSEIQLEEGEVSTNYKRREDGLASIKDLDEKQDVFIIGSGLGWSLDSTYGTTLELNIGSGLTCNSDKALIVNIGSGLAWNADGKIYANGEVSIGTATTAKVENPKLGGIIVGTGFKYDSYYGILSLGTAHNSYEVSSDALGGIIVGTGFNYNPSSGVLNLGTASDTSLGGVVIGSGFDMDTYSGKLKLDTASNTRLGGVIIGEGITVDNGTISIPKKISINPKTTGKYSFPSSADLTNSLDLSSNYIIANTDGFTDSIIYLDATILNNYSKTNRYEECKILWDDTNGVNLEIGTQGIYNFIMNDSRLSSHVLTVPNDMVDNNIYIPEAITKTNTAGSKIEITIRSYGQESKSSKTYNNYPEYGSNDYIVGTGGLSHKHYITWQKVS